MDGWAYAEQDGDFVGDVVRALAARRVRLDDAFVFVVSPEALASQPCLQALREATTANRRVVALVRRPVDDPALPAELAPAARIAFLTADSFAAGVDALVAVLGADLRFDAFLSYSRKDTATVDQLAEGLWRAGKTTWVDRSKLLASEKWRAAILAGIEAADHFVFLISPDSVVSEFCAVEVAHAVSQNKRIIPVLLRPTDRAQLPAALAERQWVDFDVGAIARALDVDPEWTRAHTELLRNARGWEQHNRDDGSLLRGAELAAAERWLTAAGEHMGRNPTPLQTELILASRLGATRRLRHLVGGVSSALVVSLLLAGVALFFWRAQKQQTQRAMENAAEAHVEEALRRGAPAEAIAWASHIPASLANANRLARAIEIGPSFTLLPSTDDRHEGAMAWSADGGRFAFGDSDGTVAVWNMSDGAMTRFGTAKKPFDAMQAVVMAFSPDGSRLASQDRAGSVALWDLHSGAKTPLDEGLGMEGGDPGAKFAIAWHGTRLAAAAGRRACVWSLAEARLALVRCRSFATGRGQFAWSPAQSKLLWISRFGIAHIWNADTDALFEITKLATSSGAFAPDGGRILLGGYDRRLRAFRLTDDRVELLSESPLVPTRLGAGQIEPAQDGTIDDGAFSYHARLRSVAWPRGKAPIAYLFAGSVGLWSVGDDTAVLVDGDDADEIAWSSDGGKLARAASEGLLRVYERGGDYRDRRVRPILGKDPAIAWSPSGRHLAVVAKNAPLELWDTEAAVERVLQLPTAYEDVIAHETRTRTFEGIAWSADDRFLAAHAWPAGVGRWSLDGAVRASFAVGEERDIIRIAWSPSGATLAYAGVDGVIHVGQQRVAGASPPAKHLAWSGDRVAVGGESKIVIWAPSGASATATPFAEIAELGGLAFSPDGARLATVTYQSAVAIFDASGKQVTALGTPSGRGVKLSLAWPRADALVVDHDGGDFVVWNPDTKTSWTLQHPTAYAWSAQGELAAADSTIVSFHDARGKETRPELAIRMEGPNQRVESLAWSPDAKLLAIGTTARTVDVFDVATRTTCTLTGHSDVVVSVAWSHAGDALASSARDGTVRIWPALWRKEALSQAAHNRSNWIIGNDLAARPARFEGLPPDQRR